MHINFSAFPFGPDHIMVRLGLYAPATWWECGRWLRLTIITKKVVIENSSDWTVDRVTLLLGMRWTLYEYKAGEVSSEDPERGLL